MQGNRWGEGWGMVGGRVCEAPNGVLLPSKVHIIVYPLQGHSRVLRLEGDKLAQRCHVGGLVGWSWWWWVQDIMVTGDEGGERLVGDGELLHGTRLDQRGWKAAEGVMLPAEHHGACWELLRVAPRDMLTRVEGEALGRYRGDCVGQRDSPLVHLLVEINHEWGLLGSRVEHSG